MATHLRRDRVLLFFPRHACVTTHPRSPLPPLQASYEQALEISRLIGHRHNEATWLANLGLAYASCLHDDELGQLQRARALWREALEIYEAVESPYAERVRGWLGE